MPEDFTEISVRVGPGQGREHRFQGRLVAELEQTGERRETYRVYRTPSGRFVVHHQRSKAHINTGPNAAKWSTGWRAWIGDWSARQSWTRLPADANVQVAEDLGDLRTLIPLRLHDLVADAVYQPVVNHLDV
ncbi:EXLDI protein [Actinoplanes sp. NPDC049265]|uniref:EXLDI protein n=1 Tax=Actinoplanes sp. NPDC049265 TaxID=3363902 RepID=UPI00371CED9F